MKNKWVEYVFGIVVVKVTGNQLERFLNILVNNQLLIWDIKRHSDKIMTFKIRLRDIKTVCSLRRSTNSKITFLKRRGLPFLLKKSYKNSGIAVGISLFLVVIFLLSNVIWHIDVTGASPQVEQKLVKQFNKLGIKVGKLQFFIDDVETIQRKLTDNIDEITWIGVELNGSKFKFTVVEKDQPEQQKLLGPQHLVAAKKGLITYMFIETGNKEVNLNDYVQKGQLLVSGTIGREGFEKNVTAKGTILGETWYKTTISLPLQLPLEGLSGKEYRNYYLNIGNFAIPVWGFHKLTDPNFQVDRTVYNLYFVGFKLPISTIKESYRAKNKTNRIFSEKEGLAIARQLARIDVLSNLDEEASIKGEKILHQTIDSGRVNVMIHFQVIENIGKGQPIIQGD